MLDLRDYRIGLELLIDPKQKHYREYPANIARLTVQFCDQRTVTNEIYARGLGTVLNRIREKSENICLSPSNIFLSHKTLDSVLTSLKPFVDVITVQTEYLFVCDSLDSVYRVLFSCDCEEFSCVLCNDRSAAVSTLEYVCSYSRDYQSQAIPYLDRVPALGGVILIATSHSTHCGIDVFGHPEFVVDKCFKRLWDGSSERASEGLHEEQSPSVT
jgi:hypothetical protein